MKTVYVNLSIMRIIDLAQDDIELFRVARIFFFFIQFSILCIFSTFFLSPIIICRKQKNTQKAQL